jgi:hypothetical protein
MSESLPQQQEENPTHKKHKSQKETEIPADRTAQQSLQVTMNDYWPDEEDAAPPLDPVLFRSRINSHSNFSADIAQPVHKENPGKSFSEFK